MNESLFFFFCLQYSKEDRKNKNIMSNKTSHLGTLYTSALTMAKLKENLTNSKYKKSLKEYFHENTGPTAH